ncbi:MAG: hypothetical protein EXQ79_05390 [Acidimicrobiia bacterium]|nr:hypothetical protein [Acidimicrobiia bacterium]
MLIAVLTASVLVVGVGGSSGAAVQSAKKPLCKGKTQAAAEAAIEDAFLHFLDGAQFPEVADKAPFIEYMSAPSVSPELLAYFTASKEKNASAAANTSVVVNTIQCKGKDSVGVKCTAKYACAQYDLVLGGNPAPGIAGPGYAVLVGKVWKVTARTFCDLSAGGDASVFETVDACLQSSIGEKPTDLEKA